MRIGLRILLLLMLLIVLPLGAILVIEPEFRLDKQHQWLDRLMTSATGREVHIGGDMRLFLGRHGRLLVRNISIANPDWAKRASLFQANEADIVIDFADLLRGIVAIEDFRLHGAQLALEASSDGQRSWRPSEADDDHAASEDRWSVSRLFRLRLEQAALEDVGIVYETPSRRHDLRLDRFRQRNENGMLLLDGSGELDGLPLRAAGSAGPLASLLNGSDIKTDLSLSLDDVVLKATGRIGDVSTFEDVAMAASLRGPDLAHILTALGIPYRHPGDVDATLEITDEDQGLSWQATGRVGGLRIASKGVLRMPARIDGLDATVDLSGEDLSALAQVLGEDGLPQQPYRLRGRLTRDGKRMQVSGLQLESAVDRIEIDATIPEYPTTVAADAKVAVRISDPQRYLQRADNALPVAGGLSIDATVRPMASQKDRSVNLDGRWGKHRVKVDGQLGERGDLSDSELRFVINGPALPVVSTSEAPPPGPYSLTGKLTVDHEGMAHLATSDGRIASGHVAVDGQLGRVPEFGGLDLSLKAKGQSLREVAGWAIDYPLSDLPFSMESRVSGTWKRPALADLRATLGTMQLQTDGVLRLTDKADGSDLRFQIAAAGVPSALGGTVDRLLSAGPYTANGHVSAHNDALHLNDIKIKGDGLDVDLSAVVPLQGGLRGINLKLQADVPNLATMLPEVEGYVAPDHPLNIALNVVGSEDAVTVEEGRVELGDASLQISGTLPVDLDLKNPGELHLVLTAARLSDLGKPKQFVLEDDPLHLETKVRFSGRQAIFDPMETKIGGAQINARLRVEQRERPFIDLSVVAKGIDFRRIGSHVSETSDLEPVTDSEKEPKHLIPETPLDLGFLDKFDGVLKLQSTEMYVTDPRFADTAVIRQAHISAALDAGTLKIEHIDLDGDRGKTHGHGTISVRDQQTTIDANLQARANRFSMLAAGQVLKELPEHAFDLHLATTGRTYRDLAARLNGSLHLTGGAGIISHQGLAKDLGPFFSDVVSRLNPLTRSDSQTAVECTAAAISVTDGVIRLDPGFVLRAAKLDIAAMGTVDLRTERLDVQLHGAPREGIGISAAGIVRTFIKVGGTLSKPGIALDTPKALVSGTAAVATGGLSILATSLLDRLATASNPCETLIEQADRGKSKTSLNPIDGLGNALRKTLQHMDTPNKREETESVLDLVD